MRRQRVLLTLAAVLLALVVLMVQDPPASAATRAPTRELAAGDSTEGEGPYGDPHDEEADNEARRSTSIAIGMVVAALAIGGLLVFSGN